MRLATDKDLPRIVEIYNSTVPARLSTADTQEVSVESRVEWFRKHIPEKRPILVHEMNDAVVGWVSFESFYSRPAYHQTAEISIYIAPERRGKGLGRHLLREMIEIAPKLGIKTLVGYIFSHNLPSIRLFKSFRFEEWGRLPNIAEMDGREYSLSIFGKRVNP